MDADGDATAHKNLWSNNYTLPSVYYATDGVNFFFRVRVQSDPWSSNGGFKNDSRWQVSIG